MRVYDCTQEQNGSPYLSFIVRQYMQMAYDRKVVEIKKFPSIVTYYIVLFIPFGKEPVLVFNANTNNERRLGTSQELCKQCELRYSFLSKEISMKAGRVIFINFVQKKYR